MQGDFSLVYSIGFDCVPSALEPLCHLPLPHGSPLGRYDQPGGYGPGDGWPATFLCLRHGVACVRSPEEIQNDLDLRVPGEPLAPLWQITCTCAHENCGRRHVLYAAREASWPEVWRRILKLAPKVPCGDHDLAWRKDLMRGTAFPHDYSLYPDRARIALPQSWADQQPCSE